MPADDPIVDEATTVMMLQQFSSCQDECTRIQGLADRAASALRARWGGAAASAYTSSMTEWQAGLNKVCAALTLLNEWMAGHSRITPVPAGGSVVRSAGGDLTHVTREFAVSLETLGGRIQQFLEVSPNAGRDVCTVARAMWDEGRTEMNNAMGVGVVALNNIHAEYVLADSKDAPVPG